MRLASWSRPQHRAPQSFRLIGYGRPASPNPHCSSLSVWLLCLKGISELASCTCSAPLPPHFLWLTNVITPLPDACCCCRLLLPPAALSASGSQGRHLEKQGEGGIQNLKQTGKQTERQVWHRDDRSSGCRATGPSQLWRELIVTNFYNWHDFGGLDWTGILFIAGWKDWLNGLWNEIAVRGCCKVDWLEKTRVCR